jgi:hypothetical protein
MINRRQAIQSFAAAAAYVATRRVSAQSASPLSLPLVTASTALFTYLGKFNGPSDGSFQYGGGALSVANSSPGVLGQLYCGGLQQGNNDLGLMNIPTPTGSGGTYKGSETATTAVSGTTGVNLGSLGGSSQTFLTGSLAYNGKLYCTGAVAYDATGSQNAFMVVGNTNVSGFGSACHYAGSSSGVINRMFSNGMGLVPSVWQSTLGGTAFIFGGPGGMSGLSIISQMACGYGFNVFNPANVASGGAVSMVEYLNYPFTSTGNTQQVSVLWGYSPATQSNWGGQVGDNYISVYDNPVACAFIAPNSRSLLFIHAHSYGPAGNRGSSPCDPNGNASGSNESPIAPDTQPYRRVQVSAYDLAALVSNKQSGGAVSAPRPYAWWTFPNWQSLFGTCPAEGLPGNAWGAFDVYNSLLYLSDAGFGGTNGTIQVFSVAGGGSSPPTATPTPNAPANLSVS